MAQQVLLQVSAKSTANSSGVAFEFEPCLNFPFGKRTYDSAGVGSLSFADVSNIDMRSLWDRSRS